MNSEKVENMDPEIVENMDIELENDINEEIDDDSYFNVEQICDNCNRRQNQELLDQYNEYTIYNINFQIGYFSKTMLNFYTSP